MKDRRNLLFPLSPLLSSALCLCTVFPLFPSSPLAHECASLAHSHATFSPFSLSTFLPSSASSFFLLVYFLKLFTFHFHLVVSSLSLALPASHLLVTRKTKYNKSPPARPPACLVVSPFLFRQSLLAFHIFTSTLYPLLNKVPANCFRLPPFAFFSLSLSRFLVRVQVQVQVPSHYKMRQQKPCNSRQQIVKKKDHVHCTIE